MRPCCLLLIANDVPQKLQSPYDVLEPLSEGDLFRFVCILLHIQYLLQFHTSPCQTNMGIDLEEANQ